MGGSQSYDHIFTKPLLALSPSPTCTFPHPPCFIYFMPFMPFIVSLSYVSGFFFVPLQSHPRSFTPRTCLLVFFFLALTAVHACQPQLHTISCCYSTPTSVLLRLSHQLLQFNSPFLSFTIFTTRYSPFSLSYVHTITHLPTSLSSKNPPYTTPTALGSKYSYKGLIL